MHQVTTRSKEWWKKRKVCYLVVIQSGLTLRKVRNGYLNQIIK